MACSPGRSAENRPIHQRRTSDAGAQGQQNRIAFSPGGAPEDLRNQSRASVVIGIDRQALWLNYVRQEPSFEEVQVSGQAIDPRGRTVDHALAPDADSANRLVGAFEDRVNKVMQGGWGARRWLVEVFDQVSAKGYQRSLNRSGCIDFRLRISER
jgi:hypothetical protein